MSNVQVPKFQDRPVRFHHTPTSWGVVERYMTPYTINPKAEPYRWWDGHNGAAVPGWNTILVDAEEVSLLSWEWSDE